MTKQELAELFEGYLKDTILELTPRQFDFLMVHYDPDCDILIHLDSSGFIMKAKEVITTFQEIEYKFN